MDPEAIGVLVTSMIRNIRYSLCAAYCVQIFEWLSLLDNEVAYVHQHSWSLVTLAYVLCRYYPLVTWPAALWASLGDHRYEVCQWAIYLQILSMPLVLLPPAVMALRTYAFSERNVKVLIILSTLFALLTGMSIWNFCIDLKPPPRLAFVFTGNQLGENACGPDYSEEKMRVKLVLTQATLLFADLISLCIVLFYCHVHHGRTKLAKFFIQQGAGAFLLICLLNGLAIGFYFLPSMASSSIGLPFLLLLPNTIACRLILQLRQEGSPANRTAISRINSQVIRDAFPADSIQLSVMN
ncbi:hypothetical protein BDQ12DRAFT_393389 [Crucibulum laeve]|uniref:DUF6533 domain-containing protein n=1 Tax=Crucibulum laeve TaxID=68775 RepID=A0A5C3M9Z7_9AGAR|nr:hypothetical protein BDQ12DRAFT_393389 [Crucibulum laeve]